MTSSSRIFQARPAGAPTLAWFREGLALAALLLALLACGDSLTSPSAVSRMVSVSGDAQSGIAGHPLDGYLVVRAFDSDNLPVPNASVTWEVISGGGSITPGRARSDQAGFARATWTLGTEVGEQVARANVGGAESIVFRAIASEADPTCDGGAPLNLPLGGTVLLVGNAASEVCLAGNASGQIAREFAVVAFNANRAANNSILFDVRGTGIVTAVFTPSPAADVLQTLQVPERRDHEFDARLRQRELEELAPLVRRTGGAPTYSLPPPSMSLASPILGEVLNFNVQANSACGEAVMRGGRVVALSQRAVVVADTANPAGGFTEAEYAELAATFDTLIYPMNTGHFGEPTDIDRNSRIVLFYTRAVNALSQNGSSGGFVAGFFFSRDLFPRSGTSTLEKCPGSNEAEIMYLMVPGTVNGITRSKDFVRRRTLSTMAHELTHLINASRRLHVNPSSVWPERAWLDEGLAHSAEELLFLRATGLNPGQNIGASALQASSLNFDAYNDYQSENVARLRDFLFFTNTTWTNRQSGPTLSERGAATFFLRYLVDRLTATSGSPPETQVWRALVNSPDTGMRNLEGVIHADPMQWMRDWSAALFADDVHSGVPARYRIASWNMRSVFSITSAGNYPIQVATLNNNVYRPADLRSGGSLFYKFGVPAGGTGRFEVRYLPGIIPEQLSLVVVRYR